MLSNVAAVESLFHPVPVGADRPARGDKPVALLLQLKKRGGGKDSKKISERALKKNRHRKEQIQKKGQVGLTRPSRSLSS